MSRCRKAPSISPWLSALADAESAALKWSKLETRRCVKISNALLQSQAVGIYETTTKTGNERYIPLRTPSRVPEKIIVPETLEKISHFDRKWSKGVQIHGGAHSMILR